MKRDDLQVIGLVIGIICPPIGVLIFWAAGGFE